MGFFETLGDKLLAGGEEIFKGFVSGGLSGGLQAGALALVGGAPSGTGGVPPRVARSQSEVRRSLTAGLVTARPPIGTVPIGFGSTGGPIARSVPSVRGFSSVQQFDRTVARTKLGIGGLVGGVFQRIPGISGERFGRAFAQAAQPSLGIGPFPSGPLPPGPPPPREFVCGDRLRNTGRRGVLTTGVSISTRTERRFRNGRSFEFCEGRV